MRRPVWGSFVLVAIGLSLLGAGGCGGGDGGGGESSGVKTYDPASLPKTKQELPPLDGGRLEIPTPAGWHFGSREKSLIARFHLEGRSGIPQILVKLESDAAADAADVTPDSVRQFADQIQAQLDSAGTKLLEPCRPLVLGGNCWARYVVPGKLPGKQKATIERQVLKTVRGGRAYMIDLQVPAKELLKYRDAAYAIGAGIKFQAPTGASDPPPDETEAPADEKAAP